MVVHGWIQKSREQFYHPQLIVKIYLKHQDGSEIILHHHQLFAIF